MGLIVSPYVLILDLILAVAIGYALFFLYRRIGKYDVELNILIKYSFIFLLLAEIGRLLDLVDDFCCRTDFVLAEGTLYFVSIVGVIYTVIRYIMLVELRYMPSVAMNAGTRVKSRPRVPKQSSPFSVGAYVIFSRYRLSDVLELLKDADFPMMAVTRSPSIYESFSKGNISVLWVTQVPGGVQPTALHVIQDRVLRFVQENPGAVVIVDSVEYLLLYNDFKTVFKFLVNLKDYLLALRGTLMIFVDDTVVTPQEKSFLMKEFEPL